MDDEFEDKVLYQAYVSHMKLMSKIAVGLPTGLHLNFPMMSYFWRILRMCASKPEVVVCSAIFIALLFYLQALDLWSRTLIGKIQYTLGRTTSKVSKLQYLMNNAVGGGDHVSWELKQDYVAAYAVQGHRSHMEDRFVVNDDINNTGVSIFAIFDGHGGEFAANYARDKLIPNINKKVVELKDMLAGRAPKNVDEAMTLNNNGDERQQQQQQQSQKDNERDDVTSHERRKSFRKTMSTSVTDECLQQNQGVTDPELLNKLNSLIRPITKEVKPTREKPPPKVELSSYLEGDKINYGRLISDEVLAVDRLLVEAAKKNMDVAGTTALIALLEGDNLIVANVGDSRGVMCDGRGNAIPLSFDHKPQQQREKTRINKAGGRVTFNGVWRVAGILATSRALGDYPLKDKKLVIADPDILTFDLSDHNASFLVLATDGLWDIYTNEEAVAYIKSHINEPHYGAKSITLQSFYRGSLDNITVLVINLANRKQKTP